MRKAIPQISLRALPLIAKTGSVSKAARALGVSQPAVSRAIGVLEQQIGAPVLRRGRIPLMLTDEGMILARCAEREDVLFAQAVQDVATAKRGKSGVVRIGSFGASASMHLLPGLMRNVARLHPDLRIDVHEVPDRQVLAALNDGTIDFGVVVEDTSVELDTVPLGTDQLVALVPDDHDLAQRQSLSPSDLLELPFIMTKGGSEPLVRAWFEHAGAVPQSRHTIQQITSILSFVKAGFGVSVIAELALPEIADGVTILPLLPAAPRVLSLARLFGTPRSPVLEAFWNVASNHTSDQIF